jgi:ubiquinone/menaquinone biosynthesis C-methylase UbiE
MKALVSFKSKTAAGSSPAGFHQHSSSAEHQKAVDAHFGAHAAQWKEVYEESGIEGAIYRKRLETVLSWIDELALPAGEQALDIGCGGGASVVALAQRGYVVQAIDSAPEMLNSTRRALGRAGLSDSVLTKLEDVHNLGFPEDSFGLILAVGVIPYLHSPRKALEEMARTLKPGGFLLVTAGNRWRLNHALDPWLCPALQPVRRVARAAVTRFRRTRTQVSGPPLRLDTLRELERWLCSVGLTKVKAQTVGFQPLRFRGRPIFEERTSIKLNRWLQKLADYNVPVIRSTGMDYIVLAGKKDS